MVEAITKLNDDKEPLRNSEYSKVQKYLLLGLRVIIGYHFLFEGITKLFSDSWTSGGFLIQSNWIFSELFIAIANSPTLVTISDFLNIWGQIFIGLGLILGLYSRYAAIFGAILLFLYYITIPPFVGSATFVDRNLLELLGLLIIAFFPMHLEFGFDGMLSKIRSGKNG